MRTLNYMDLSTPRHRRLQAILAIACLCGMPGAWSADLMVYTSADTTSAAPSSAQQEYLQQLQVQYGRKAQASARLRINTINELGAARSPSGSAPADDVTAGIRTRSIPGRSTSAGSAAAVMPATSATDQVQVAVGLDAARRLLDQAGQQGPLLLALLSRPEWDALRQLPALTHPQRPIAVLLREPAISTQVALAEAILPANSKLGVVATTSLEPMVQELQRNARSKNLIIGYAADARALASTLQDVLPRSDGLLILSDRLGDETSAGITLLHAAATARKPAFATSEAGVRAGALAGAIPTPAQLAQQTLALSNYLSDQGTRPPWPPALVAYARPISVYVNPNVAQRLGMTLPDTQLLAERVNAAP